MIDTLINTILVDDSYSIRLALSTFLKDLGITQLHQCDSGRSALEKISTDSDINEIIFIDLNMPEMDGMELIRHLGERQYAGGVVIISGMDNKIIDLASELACNNKVHLIGSITKPFQQEHIQQVLTRYTCFKNRQAQSEVQLSKDEIVEAIHGNRIIPYYQPKVNCNDYTVTGLEVLVRIENPSSGVAFLPYQFIPSAEKYGLIDELSEQLIKKALCDYKDLLGVIGEQLKLAFNVSPSQLNNLNIHKKFESLIHSHGISPSQLVIEITEEFALETSNQLESLNRLRMKGYGIALDDYGTGFTNISQLRHLPFSEIKIDRSLISGIDSDPFSQAILKSLIDIYKNSKFELVAEGIETHDEYFYLQSMCCDIQLQGYLIAKPKPLPDLIRWFKIWSRLASNNS